MFTSLIVTGDRFEKDIKDGALIVAKKGDLKLWQTVVSVGNSVRDINIGDKVMVNVENYAVRKYDKNSLQNDLDNNKVLSFNFNWVTMDDDSGNPKDYLLLNDRDILYVFEGEETDDNIITPSKKILL